jgi:hypothetical protein
MVSKAHALLFSFSKGRGIFLNGSEEKRRQWRKARRFSFLGLCRLKRRGKADTRRKEGRAGLWEGGRERRGMGPGKVGKR